MDVKHTDKSDLNLFMGRIEIDHFCCGHVRILRIECFAWKAFSIVIPNLETLGHVCVCVCIKVLNCSSGRFYVEPFKFVSIGFLHGLNMLAIKKAYDSTYTKACTPLDGSIPAIKLSTYRRRLNVGKEVAQNEINLQKVTSLRRNMGSEFSCMIREAKILGMALGISCLNGLDSDIFLFGARTAYRDICLGDGGFVVCYEMTDIERKLGLGRDSLIALSLLLGSDYYQGIHGLGPEAACQIVKSIGDKHILKKIASEGLGWVKKRKGGKNDLGRGDNILQVINAYMKPKCHSADSDIVHK
ncbi:unnamed protein product [Sphenostylis stenocarpa]|uniref:XPG-I domain-containing protein n=1 Tax=Sphenostylis stenocarpa TaxID=92480 RepID=A0AA86VD21_9FABA|nr:unnamed protein product [Sphenostylis stenocarpa]